MAENEVVKKAIAEIVPKKGGYNEPIATHKITFQSDQTQIEPIYYWILDFIRDTGWKPKKVVDNFMASPGSGQFQDMIQRANTLQGFATKASADMNTVIKSVINLIYDLKEFEMRLKEYDKANSKDEEKKEAGILALKQIWMDNVDIKKGMGSINNMTAQYGFATLRDAFMAAKSIQHVKEMNDDNKGGLFNDTVMRVLIPRIEQFQDWKKYSEQELRKRMEVERKYLKSQIEMLKLYASWAKPYLENAEKLRQQGFEGNAALVNAFSTTMFELSLMGKKSIDKAPAKYGGGKLPKEYYSIIVVDLTYRGHLAQRATQKGDYAYAIGGRVELTLDAYALSKHELELIEKKIEKQGINELLESSTDIAIGSLEAMKEDLEHFLKTEEEREEEKKKKEEQEEKEKKKKKKENDINPFTALFKGIKELIKGKKKEKEKEEQKIETKEDLKEDTLIERAARAEAAKKAGEGVYLVYDIFKKSQGMASPPTDFENAETLATKKIKEPGIDMKAAFKKWENIK